MKRYSPAHRRTGNANPDRALVMGVLLGGSGFVISMLGVSEQRW